MGLILFISNKISFLSLIKINSNFTSSYLNDLLLVPVVLPIILFCSRIFHFRPNDAPPKIMEIVLPLLIWSLAFEFVAPHFFNLGTPDFFDVITYFVGGIISWLIWNRMAILNYFQYKYIS